MIDGGRDIRIPDISARPYELTVERDIATAPATLYQAWTTGFAGEAARDRHRQAWPLVLEQLERRVVT